MLSLYKGILLLFVKILIWKWAQCGLKKWNKQSLSVCLDLSRKDLREGSRIDELWESGKMHYSASYKIVGEPSGIIWKKNNPPRVLIYRAGDIQCLLSICVGGYDALCDECPLLCATQQFSPLSGTRSLEDQSHSDDVSVLSLIACM